MARELTGKVISDKMDKTITVDVARLKEHPLYKKKHTVNKKYKAHDEEEQAQVGDEVKITETKPISKTKRWQLAEVIREGRGGEQL